MYVGLITCPFHCLPRTRLQHLLVKTMIVVLLNWLHKAISLVFPSTRIHWVHKSILDFPSTPVFLVVESHPVQIAGNSRSSKINAPWIIFINLNKVPICNKIYFVFHINKIYLNSYRNHKKKESIFVKVCKSLYTIVY